MSRRTGCCVMNIQRYSNESGSRVDPLFHLPFGFRPPHLLHLQRNQDNRDKECDTICDRSSKEDSVDPEKQRQNQYQRNQENTCLVMESSRPFSGFPMAEKKLEEISCTPFTITINKKVRIK